LGIGRHADMDAPHGVDVRQRPQSGKQFRKVLFGIRILQPEEHVVHDWRERCLAGGRGSGGAGAGGGDADSQGGGGEDDISAAAIGHDRILGVVAAAHEYRATPSIPQRAGTVAGGSARRYRGQPWTRRFRRRTTPGLQRPDGPGGGARPPPVGLGFARHTQGGSTMHLPGWRLLAALFALALAAPHAATAQSPGTISGSQAVEVMAALRLSPELGRDRHGDPEIMFQQGGLTCRMNFFDCRNDRCGSLQLEVGLDLEAGTTPQVVNQYNRTYRYGRAYLDEDMDPYLLYDFELPHARVGEYLESQLGIFGTLLEHFTEAFGY